MQVLLLLLLLLPPKGAAIKGLGRWSRSVEEREKEREEWLRRLDEMKNDQPPQEAKESPPSNTDPGRKDPPPSFTTARKGRQLYDKEIKRRLPYKEPSGLSTPASSGHFHTCALSHRSGVSRGGPIKCWGHNDKGQATPPPGIFLQVSSGHHHSCAISIDRTLSCWGEISSPPEGYFHQVSSGGDHACAIISASGNLICWGANHHCESDLPKNDIFVQVSSGQSYSCGLRRDGYVECWGKDHEGQAQPPAGTKFKQISAGLDHHVCGITEKGNIKCWGRNSRGQSEDRDGHYIQVSTGRRSACAIRHDDKSLECWGGTSPIPLHDMKAREYTQISLGKDHACAVDVDRRLHCWQNGADLGGHNVPVGFQVGDEL